MKEIPRKDYIILVIILVITVLLVFIGSNMYLSRSKTVSKFFEYSNKIKPDEFDVYMIENTDAIIYIADRYDLTHEEFEQKLKSNIDSLNLKDKIIYIDKNEIDESFISKLSKKYKVDINIKKVPILIELVDNNIIKTIYIDEYDDVFELIDYEEFK